MKKLWFEKMAEILNSKKTILSILKGQPDLHVSCKEILEEMKNCEIFVFAEDFIEKNYSETKNEFDVLLDAPFRVFSIEMADDNNIGEMSNGELDRIRCTIVQILCIESEPKKFRTFALIKTQFLDLGAGCYDVNELDEIYPIVSDFIKRINKEKIGIEKINKRIKIGTGKNSGFNIKNIIHISSKNQQKNYKGISKEIDWSHRWMVRGHWRKTESIGKDRAGAYVIKGFTWVTEHDKGPDGKPLIRKTRIVEG